MSATSDSGPPVVLLGPQRHRPVVGDVVREVVPEGPVAVITAGWREREHADVELKTHLDGRGRNLGLYGRRADVLERDQELAALQRRRETVLAELAAAYRVRLRHGIAAVYELMRTDLEEQARQAAVDDALAALRAIDARHIELVDEVEAELEERWPLQDRGVVAAHRGELERHLDGAAAVAVAGGHVDALLDCLRLFAPALRLSDRPVFAWSAGAMVLTERVVLFHDRAPHGARYAEVHGRGLGCCPGVVALPHARRRLALDDRDRMAVLARRFAPDRCVLLDDGTRADVAGGEVRGAPVVTDHGTVDTREEAA